MKLKMHAHKQHDPRTGVSPAQDFRGQMISGGKAAQSCCLCGLLLAALSSSSFFFFQINVSADHAFWFKMCWAWLAPCLYCAVVPREGPLEMSTYSGTAGLWLQAAGGPRVWQLPEQDQVLHPVAPSRMGRGEAEKGCLPKRLLLR